MNLHVARLCCLLYMLRSNRSETKQLKVTPGALWKMQRNGKYLVWQFYGVMCSYFKACFAHWPDLKNLFQLFANFHHQSVRKAPGATLMENLQYIPEGLWCNCYNETRYISLVKMSSMDPPGGLKLVKNWTWTSFWTSWTWTSFFSTQVSRFFLPRTANKNTSWNGLTNHTPDNIWLACILKETIFYITKMWVLSRSIGQ